MVIFFQMEDVAVFIENIERGKFGTDELRDFCDADVGDAFDVEAVDFFGQRGNDIKAAALAGGAGTAGCTCRFCNPCIHYCYCIRKGLCLCLWPFYSAVLVYRKVRGRD